MKINQIYQKLLKHFGKQNWWPTKTNNKFTEVSIGAILTQNTNWKNVEKAIENLINENLLDLQKIKKIDLNRLKTLIKPAGFYNQKAQYIKNFAHKITNAEIKDINREFLLSIKGIGKETADSILLYGLDKPYFVVDAYTKRLFYRANIIETEKIPYNQLQNLIQSQIPSDLEIYKEFHALIVELGKKYCKKKNPVCLHCPIKSLCDKKI